MTWDYKAQRPLQIQKLHEGTPISINDPYDVNLGKAQRYFCCRCGYPCRRKPEDDKKMVNRAGKRAFFTHDNIPDHPYCKFRTEQSDGQRFSSEITGNQIVEDEHKTIVSSWCSLIEEQELSNDTENKYRGTVEDEWGPPAETPTMRHIDLKELRERKIHSVQYIAWHLHDFLDRDIQLPGCNTYSLFQDVFFHASQTAGMGLNTSALFWGQVQNIFFKREHYCIAFGYENHCLYLAIPKDNFHQRKWRIDSIQGKYVIVAGLLEEAPLFQAKEDESFHPRPCRKVVAQEWGASGIVSNDEVKFLPHVDEFVWVEPAIFCDEALPSKEEKHFLTVSEIDDLDSSLVLPSIPSNPESEKEGSNINELPTGPVTKQYDSSPSNDTSIPDVFTDAQLRRAKRKRWIRMKKLIRLARKIEAKMHN